MGLTVLPVEDNPGDQTLFRHHLRSNSPVGIGGVDVDCVDTLTDAVETVDPATHDVVLLDLGLPESTGIETVERLLEAESRVPVVVLTGLDDDAVALEAIECGAQDYLVKGQVDPDVLVRSIRYAIERERKERELQRQNDRLREFASVVSHDLRNPLNVARGYLEAVRSDPDPALVDEVDRSLERVAHDAWDTVDTGAATLDLAVGEASVAADRERLRTLFENLFRNSVEHGGASVTVRVGIDGDGFFVADDGPGIAPEKRDWVFEAGNTGSDTGTGFGPSIVRRIAEAHGWTVSVDGSEAGGARFDFGRVTFAGETEDDDFDVPPVAD